MVFTRGYGIHYGFHPRMKVKNWLVYSLQSTCARRDRAWRAALPSTRSHRLLCDRNIERHYAQAYCPESFIATHSLPSCTTSTQNIIFEVYINDNDMPMDVRDLYSEDIYRFQTSLQTWVCRIVPNTFSNLLIVSQAGFVAINNWEQRSPADVSKSRSYQHFVSVFGFSHYFNACYELKPFFHIRNTHSVSTGYTYCISGESVILQTKLKTIWIWRLRQKECSQKHHWCEIPTKDSVISLESTSFTVPFCA